MEYFLNYDVFGKGPKKMLAFHGFGQHNYVYAPLAQALPDYTIYSFDLFYHGKSLWNSKQNLLGPARWKEILSEFLHKENIRECSLAGFSMGGRVALASVPLLDQQLRELWLIAPDGIKPNAWYRVATTMPPFQQIFKRIASDDSSTFNKLVNLVNRFKLVDKSIVRLAEIHMSPPALRQRVYNTWTLYSKLNPSLREVSRLLNAHEVTTRIFLGRYDRLIPIPEVQRFAATLNKQELHILDKGHYNLIYEVAAWISAQAKTAH